MVITPLEPNVCSEIHRNMDQWGKGSDASDYAVDTEMRHNWLVNSNGAHLVMLTMMALSQQDTGNQ